MKRRLCSALIGISLVGCSYGRPHDRRVYQPPPQPPRRAAPPWRTPGPGSGVQQPQQPRQPQAPSLTQQRHVVCGSLTGPYLVYGAFHPNAKLCLELPAGYRVAPQCPTTGPCDHPTALLFSAANGAGRFRLRHIRADTRLARPRLSPSRGGRRMAEGNLGGGEWTMDLHLQAINRLRVRYLSPWRRSVPFGPGGRHSYQAGVLCEAEAMAVGEAERLGRWLVDRCATLTVHVVP